MYPLEIGQNIHIGSKEQYSRPGKIIGIRQLNTTRAIYVRLEQKYYTSDIVSFYESQIVPGETNLVIGDIYLNDRFSYRMDDYPGSEDDRWAIYGIEESGEVLLSCCVGNPLEAYICGTVVQVSWVEQSYGTWAYYLSMITPTVFLEYKIRQER